MLKIISLKRSIETNTKINLWVGGGGGKITLEVKRCGLSRDVTEIRQLNMMKILWQ